SDHGFCTIKSEVQLSRYLVDEGWTAPAADGAKHPLDMDASRSRAYSLIPGRVWVNVRGREPGGIVEAEDYDAVRDELASTLLALRAPNGDAVIRQVLRREEVYWPAGATDPDPDMPVDEVLKTDTAFGRAADLIAIPHDGYDLKMGLAKPRTFETTELEGMHTFHDALILSRGVRLPEGRFCIHNVTRRILEAMDVIPPKDMD
ncbi:MAG TPA: alkaline phosphatase family protein, partial [Planctomycetota bacterium]|nr:alkaline phosphatase family protein [Planctomycetota bacterium]